MKAIHRLGFRRRVLTIATAVTITASLGAASPVALAAPQGIFSVFAQCPTSVPGLEICQYVEATSGELAIGPMRVPVEKTIVFQGGALPTEGINVYFLIPATNGESVSPTRQDIPGGLHTVLGCPEHRDRPFWRRPAHTGCRGLLHGPRNDRVTATIETVANQTNPAILDLAALIFEDGTALTFPARLHLENHALGEACYLGSEAHPIELHLTDATTSPPPPNQPIKGQLGTQAVNEEGGYELDTITNDTLVDNAFSVPPAEGCGGPGTESPIDRRIDQTLGLESPAGHNTAILSGTHKAALAEAVRASEKFPT